MYCKKNAFTLIDVLLATVILIIAIAGALQFRYHSAIQTRKAGMRTSAAELALMLIETWRGIEGADTFECIGHFETSLNITSSTGPGEPSGYNLLGSYEIQWSDYVYTATLSSRDIGNGLKALNVAVAWPFGYSNSNKEYRMTSYVDTNQ